MKKKISILCLVLVCVLALAGCGCKHETWNDADCVTPKTCAECGETEGEALGHDWVDADCLTPKTCAECGETEGEALGHDWVDADCVNAKTCSACGETEGEALGHSWVDATTEAPKTCEACGETEGDRIITDGRFHTADCAPYFGTWKGEMTLTGDMMATLGLDGVEGEISVNMTYVFRNNGELTLTVEVADWDAFMDLMLQYTMDVLYAEMAANGFSQEATDSLMLQYYGMSTADYAAAALSAMKPEDVNSTTEMVYYVENGSLYTASNWNQSMYKEDCTLDGDTMQIRIENFGDMVMTRVAE